MLISDNRIASLHEHTYFEGGPLKVGQRIEALDETNKWKEASVLEVDNARNEVGGWVSGDE